MLIKLTYLHASSETKDKVERRFLLDIVVRKSTAVFELLAGENQALLIGRYAFLVLDLGLDVVNSVARLNLEGDSLSGNYTKRY